MKNILLICMLTVLGFTSFAQDVLYTDYNPSYTKWQPNYILDKIEYTDERTIFYFRFMGKYAYGGSASFHGRTGEFPWYLENVDDSSKKARLSEIKNIRQNGELKVHSQIDEPVITFYYEQYDVFTCEVHFPRLKNNVKNVHLVEGIGKKEDENHFNCFNIKLKTFDDPTLGTEEDLEERIEEFIAVNTGEIPPSTNEPTILIEVVEEETVVDIEPPYPNS